MKELRKPYILYVGSNYPHKNLKRLILAFNKLTRDDKFDYELVLVTDNFISDKELDKLYKDADLFVFPSLSEGFGLPPLEAMVRCLPVVCSHNAALPEILGEAAIYFDPLDIDDMAKKIKKALVDKGLRTQLINSGLEQVKKYSWAKMAKETLKIYQSIL